MTKTEIKWYPGELSTKDDIGLVMDFFAKNMECPTYSEVVEKHKKICFFYDTSFDEEEFSKVWDKMASKGLLRCKTRGGLSGWYLIGGEKELEVTYGTNEVKWTWVIDDPVKDDEPTEGHKESVNLRHDTVNHLIGKASEGLTEEKAELVFSFDHEKANEIFEHLKVLSHNGARFNSTSDLYETVLEHLIIDIERKYFFSLVSEWRELDYLRFEVVALSPEGYKFIVNCDQEAYERGKQKHLKSKEAPTERELNKISVYKALDEIEDDDEGFSTVYDSAWVLFALYTATESYSHKPLDKELFFELLLELQNEMYVTLPMEGVDKGFRVVCNKPYPDGGLNE